MAGMVNSWNGYLSSEIGISPVGFLVRVDGHDSGRKVFRSSGAEGLGR